MEMMQAKGYVDADYLKATGELLARAKLRSYACLQIEPGHRVLDVGCGPATDTLALGALASPLGRVVGIDRDAAMIAEARRRASLAGMGEWVVHDEADATSLPFDAGEFDA